MQPKTRCGQSVVSRMERNKITGSLEIGGVGICTRCGPGLRRGVAVAAFEFVEPPINDR
jgi:hypothetical protein